MSVWSRNRAERAERAVDEISTPTPLLYHLEEQILLELDTLNAELDILQAAADIAYEEYRDKLAAAIDDEILAVEKEIVKTRAALDILRGDR